MMTRRKRSATVTHSHTPTMQAEIAHTAARLMAVDGVSDYASAKRKAVRQLGLPEGYPLPPNRDIEDALRSYQALYQADEHDQVLFQLRQVAVRWLRQMAPFNPYLTGSVLNGTAGRFSHVDLHLFADSAKEVEIFLLNHGVDFDHGTPRNERAEAMFVVEDEFATANLIVFPPDAERVVVRARDGRVHERARLPAVEALIEETRPSIGVAS
jgi:hypothetical protein